MIYIETGSTDVCYDFALEYYFTLEKRLSDTVFLFWRTTPTLMVGKYQNVLEEVDKPYADAHGIRIRAPHERRRYHLHRSGRLAVQLHPAPGDGGDRVFPVHHAGAGGSGGDGGPCGLQRPQRLDHPGTQVLRATPSTGWAVASSITARCCSIRTCSRWRPQRPWTATRSSPRGSSPFGTGSPTLQSICRLPWIRRRSKNASWSIYWEDGAVYTVTGGG